MVPSISVVVPARNEEQAIGPCLESILASEVKPLEIIVIDNGSTDRTAEIAQSYEGVKVIFESRPGLHIARQTGLENALGDVVAATDSDCLVSKQWIGEIAKAFELPSTVETYGPLEFFDGPWLDKSLSKYIYPVFLFIQDRLGQPNTAGGNHAVRRTTALEVGGYDRPFGEDLALMMKLKERGNIVYIPKGLVLTSARRLKKGRWKMYGLHIINSFKRVLGKETNYGQDYYSEREQNSEEKSVK